MSRPLLLAALILTGCTAPGPAEQDQVSAHRADVMAGIVPHIRKFAAPGAKIYLEPTDYPYPEDLHALERIAGIPVGRRTEVLRCRVGKEVTACWATDHKVVLARLHPPTFQGTDSAQMRIEVLSYTPGRYEVFGKEDLVFLKRRGEAWVIERVENIWVS